eukprot:3432677-Pyramimonas_sp.AAC.2
MYKRATELRTTHTSPKRPRRCDHACGYGGWLRRRHDKQIHTIVPLHDYVCGSVGWLRRCDNERARVKRVHGRRRAGLGSRGARGGGESVCKCVLCAAASRITCSAVAFRGGSCKEAKGRSLDIV